MFREAQQWRVQTVNANTDFDPNAAAASLRLDPNLTVHDVWALADVYFKGATFSEGWFSFCRLEFLNQNQVIAEMRVDRSNWTEVQPGFASSMNPWQGAPQNFERLLGLTTPSGGAQPTIRWNGGSSTGRTDIDVASFRVRVKATEVRLFVEKLRNQSVGAAVTFALGLRILSHRPT